MAAAILTPTTEHLQQAAKWLQTGGLVAVPTETVYGLAAHACNEQAVKKIFTVKERPLFDPLIVHVLGKAEAEAIAEAPPQAILLMEQYWPGPLTIVLKKKPIIPLIVTAGKATVGIRAPSHPILQALLRKACIPLAAPSANPFGYISPTQPKHVARSIGDRIPYIIDGGKCAIGLESTIIDLADPTHPCLLRLGPITTSDLEATLGVPIKPPRQSTERNTAQQAPGMLEKHYSPKTPCILLSEKESPPISPNKRTAQVWAKRPSTQLLPKEQGDHYWLSEDDNLQSIAQNLYTLMQELDQQQYDLIYFRQVSPNGIGKAINDRLKRACQG